MNILKEIPRGKGLTVDEEVLRLLVEYDYPGNIRELNPFFSRRRTSQSGILDVKSLPLP